jgi:hypothetical protein
MDTPNRNSNSVYYKRLLCTVHDLRLDLDYTLRRRIRKTIYLQNKMHPRDSTTNHSNAPSFHQLSNLLPMMAVAYLLGRFEVPSEAVGKQIRPIPRKQDMAVSVKMTRIANITF